MNLREVAIGDTILAVSVARGVTIYGVVTEHEDSGKTYIGTFSFPLLGDDWEVWIVDAWPPGEIVEARSKGRKVLIESESNIADKVLLEVALDAALDHLEERRSRRTAPAGPFWKRGRR